MITLEWINDSALGWICPVCKGKRPLTDAEIRQDIKGLRSDQWADYLAQYRGHRWNCLFHKGDAK